MIELHLHTILQLQTEAGAVRKVIVELPPGATLAAVLEQFNVQLPLDGLILIVNGRLASAPDLLNDGDVVHIIPALSGG